MLRRKIENKMLEWKNNHQNIALIVLGARQVGKTYIINKFALDNYSKVISLNFLEHPDYIDIFDGGLDCETIIKQITLRIPNAYIEDGKTVIFLDEIQACPNAITALKFMAMDNRFDVIASGSLLGVSYDRVASFPVGYVERLEMNSLDFEEFCWANGLSSEAIDYLKEDFDNLRTVSLSTHQRMMELFKEYIVVGGMPKVVSDFVTNHNFNNVLRLQRNIINDYRDDIVKYALNDDKAKIRMCFDSIPKHLSKDYKKLQ